MAASASDFTLEQNKDGWIIAGYAGDEERLSIPDSIDGAPVVLIAKEALMGNLNLVELEIPASVTFIGNFAFANCPSLERVVMKAHVATLNLNTFWDCPSLQDVELPEGLLKIGDGAFRECTALRMLDMPSTVTEIGDSAFRNCTGLHSIVIGEKVATIQRNAFRDCTGLASVAVHDAITYIGPRAFQGCTALDSVTILGSAPDQVIAAFMNHSMTYLVADQAISRHAVSFEEGKKLFKSDKPFEKLFAARVIASYPDRLASFTMKQSLAKTLAEGGCIDELGAMAQQGALSEAALQQCIDAASGAGHMQAVAYLLDLLAQNAEGPAEGSAFDSMKL